MILLDLDWVRFVLKTRYPERSRSHVMFRRESHRDPTTIPTTFSFVAVCGVVNRAKNFPETLPSRQFRGSLQGTPPAAPARKEPFPLA